MTKTRTRANGDADVYPRKNKDGKVVSVSVFFLGRDAPRS